jgi:predicted  nucleic acid-binding Zn-ribbon protein
MNKYGKMNLNLYQDKKDKNYSKIKNFSTPKNIKLKLKNIRFCELPKTLSNKLGHKIIKEALILGLREELNYNEKRKRTLLKYLTDVNKLKEKVKKNKEDVEENCEKLKQEFYDKFKIIDAYEKQINLLNEEKKEIIKTNNEIISMKNKITDSLKKQLNKLQKEVEAQRLVIDELKGKILVLEEKKSNLDKELEEILAEEEKKYEKLLEEFSLLSKKCEYYEIEYNKFDKYPEEKIKEDLNLYDNTKTNDLLTEENLKVELAEKNFVRDELINSVKNLNTQIFLFEEKLKEIKEKEKLYGKPLSAIDKKPRKNNKNKKTEMNINIKTNSNINTKFNTTSNRRTKTIPNTKRRRFFG